MSILESINTSIVNDAMLVITVITAIVIPVTAYVCTRYFRTRYEKRKDWKSQFNDVVSQLSKRNETSQLAAAIMLRRFFNAQIDKEEFRDEVIRVIAAHLKQKPPTGVYQKTLGDGLAFSGNLDYADLVRTNLQDLYLGVKNKSDDEEQKQVAKEQYEEELRKTTRGEIIKKENDSTDEGGFHLPDEKWVLTMDFTDLYEAELCDTLIEHVRGFGTIFYSANMRNTRIKNCEFINANFHDADLMNAIFTNVVLTGSDFSGAKNLPDGLLDYLDDNGIFHDKPEDKQRGFTSKRSKPDRKNIFFSMPGSLKESDEAIIKNYKALIERLGYNPVFYTRNYSKFGQITEVREKIDDSVGIIAFGLKQIHIQQGTYRPQLSDEKKLFGHWMATPWNNIEVGMAMMKELPVLLVKDKDIGEGVFDQMINENKMKTIPADIKIEGVRKNQSFIEWLDLIREENLTR